MRRKILLSLLLLILAMGIPLLFVRPVPAAEAEEPPPPSPSGTPAPRPTPGPSPLPRAVEDTALRFTAEIQGEVYDCSMADYLPGVLAGEMPAAFHQEALKAQAVAARTYILHCMGRENPEHPEADVCDDAACCKAFLDARALQERWGENYPAYWDKMCRAVAGTDGQYLTYGGEPILAAFHSSSAGRTEDAASLWARRPYLVSVESPEKAEDVPDYVTTVEIAEADFRDTVLEAYPAAELSGGAETWLGDVELEDSGRVAAVSVGGAEISGQGLRELFALRSTAFTLEYREDSFCFTVTGYGHGVGMSQYGANVMAGEGATHREILAHYYPGTTLQEPKTVESHS